MAGESLIDRVVDDLIVEVMQAHLASRADVHGWTQPYRFQTLENFDVFAGISSGRGSLFPVLVWRNFHWIGKGKTGGNSYRFGGHETPMRQTLAGRRKACSQA